ncbi:MAG TPA: hypothetical protein VKW06_22800 [Candidatus Angelobacter sp.]|nr:hypothetical protein [Candidatus Angelobacter sp.]
MLAKCANPACSTPLIYLREGKIFMMDHAGNSKSRIPNKGSGQVEHFWLCGPCSMNLTIVYHPGSGVWVVPKEPKARYAVAS